VSVTNPKRHFTTLPRQDVFLLATTPAKRHSCRKINENPKPINRVETNAAIARDGQNIMSLHYRHVTCGNNITISLIWATLAITCTNIIQSYPTSTRSRCGKCFWKA
jgi:hypothetical protein